MHTCPTLDRDHISQLAISKSLAINHLLLKPLNDASISIMKSATAKIGDRVDVTAKSEIDDTYGVCIYTLSINGNHHGDASVLVRSDF